jgi:hypothetical protein
MAADASPEWLVGAFCIRRFVRPPRRPRKAAARGWMSLRRLGETEEIFQTQRGTEEWANYIVVGIVERNESFGGLR